MAEQYGATLYLFTAIDDRIYDDSLFVIYAEQEIRENRRQAAEERLNKLAEKVQKDHPQVKVEKVLRFGIAFLEIIRFAKEEDIDLIVMSSHGRTGLTHMLLGSTTEKVVRKAPCPVLTVRPREHEFVLP